VPDHRAGQDDQHEAGGDGRHQRHGGRRPDLECMEERAVVAHAGNIGASFGGEAHDLVGRRLPLFQRLQHRADGAGHGNVRKVARGRRIAAPARFGKHGARLLRRHRILAQHEDRVWERAEDIGARHDVPGRKAVASHGGDGRGDQPQNGRLVMRHHDQFSARRQRLDILRDRLRREQETLGEGEAVAAAAGMGHRQTQHDETVAAVVAAHEAAPLVDDHLDVVARTENIAIVVALAAHQLDQIGIDLDGAHESESRHAGKQDVAPAARPDDERLLAFRPGSEQERKIAGELRHERLDGGAGGGKIAGEAIHRAAGGAVDIEVLVGTPAGEAHQIGAAEGAPAGGFQIAAGGAGHGVVDLLLGVGADRHMGIVAARQEGGKDQPQDGEDDGGGAERAGVRHAPRPGEGDGAGGGEHRHQKQAADPAELIERPDDAETAGRGTGKVGAIDAARDRPEAAEQLGKSDAGAHQRDQQDAQHDQHARRLADPRLVGDAQHHDQTGEDRHGGDGIGAGKHTQAVARREMPCEGEAGDDAAKAEPEHGQRYQREHEVIRQQQRQEPARGDLEGQEGERGEGHPGEDDGQLAAPESGKRASAGGPVIRCQIGTARRGLGYRRHSRPNGSRGLEAT
jgi:hypothetical protein